MWRGWGANWNIHVYVGMFIIVYPLGSGFSCDFVIKSEDLQDTWVGREAISWGQMFALTDKCGHRCPRLGCHSGLAAVRCLAYNRIRMKTAEFPHSWRIWKGVADLIRDWEGIWDGLGNAGRCPLLGLRLAHVPPRLQGQQPWHRAAANRSPGWS